MTTRGSDTTEDFTSSTLNFRGERKILALTDVGAATGVFPKNYDMPLGWAKPSWGAWSLRDVDIIDIRRIPSQRPGYCYGAKIMYIDTNFWHPLWGKAYDTSLTLWKLVSIHPAVSDLPTRTELVAHYSAAAQRSVEHAPWYAVMASFKLAIVLEGTHARACAGKAPKNTGDLLHTMAVGLLNNATVFIEKGI